MTDIKQKALALVNEAEDFLGQPRSLRLRMELLSHRVAFTAIERHEADMQRVSDEMGVVDRELAKIGMDEIAPCRVICRSYIINPPGDPLVEALEDWARTPGSNYDVCTQEQLAETLRAALSRHGLSIVEGEG